MLERIRTALKKRKVKVFLLFLFFSSLAWFINTLSQRFESTTSFVLEYVNVPKNHLLASAPKATIDVRLQALGFAFVGFEIKKRTVRIDLADTKQHKSQYYIPPKTYTNQIKKQLPQSIKLIDIASDTLFINLQQLLVKTVPVIPNLTLHLANNYMLDSTVIVAPKTVVLRGPKQEIDSITSLSTTPIVLENISTSFSKNIAVYKDQALTKTTITPSNVTLTASVNRFSEKLILVPVTLTQVPDSIKVRTFPDHVQVRCQGTLGALKSVSEADIEVSAHYINQDSRNTLTLSLTKIPKALSNATLLTTEVEFIVNRK